ncbi:MAG: NADP-dependent oxidoreductase [Alteromonadaceae bacterium]|nr:NADP-dependent oxidoreductase [Alteromonadaceae bacterium]
MKGLIVKDKQLILKHDLKVPKPGKGEVLVRVISSSINQIDQEVTQGKYDWLLKLSGGNHPVKTGIEFSGVIAEDGYGFYKGEPVFGYVHLTKGCKAHQEYLNINANFLAKMPTNISFEEAASLPLGALTSHAALTELGGVSKGTKILIIGASGGLGVYAVQFAKIFGASVTAVAGDNQEEFLKSIGAARVINYRETPLEQLTEQFDVVLDLSNKKLFKEVKSLLKENGTFIPAEANKHFVDLLLSLIRTQKTKYLYVDRGDKRKLEKIAKLVEQGELKPFVDSVYSLANYQQAFQRLSASGRRGRIVINISCD